MHRSGLWDLTDAGILSREITRASEACCAKTGAKKLYNKTAEFYNAAGRGNFNLAGLIQGSLSQSPTESIPAHLKFKYI